MANRVPVVSDETMQCPYVKVHQPLRSHFEKHLIRVNEPEYSWHLSECPSRASIETYKYIVDPGVPRTSLNNAVQFHPEIEASEDWDDVDVPTYNPQEYASNAAIIRTKVGAPPSERKAFREAERRRLRDKLN